MAVDAWGGSWGTSWALSWTRADTPAAAEPPAGGGWLPTRAQERAERKRRRDKDRGRDDLRESLARAYAAVFGEAPPLLADGDALPATRAALADTSASPVATLPAPAAVDWGELDATVAQMQAAIRELVAIKAAIEEDEAEVEMLLLGDR